MDAPKTPELDKMLECHNARVIIGGFLEWAESNGYELVKNVTGDGPHFENYQVSVVNERVVAECFEIDMAKADQERKALARWHGGETKKHHAPEDQT